MYIHPIYMSVQDHRRPLTKVLGTPVVVDVYKYSENILLRHEPKLDTCSRVNEI